MDLPSPGLGTFRNTEYDQCVQSVKTALELGYRHIDTAERYDNEVAVGAGLAATDISREEVVLATKVLHPRITDTATPAAIQRAARQCLERLGVDGVDLLYVHWPNDYDLTAAGTAFTALRDAGVMEHVGVCNFTIDLLETARSEFPPIAVNQIEMHPLLQQPDLREYCHRNNISIVAYAPLIQGAVGDVPTLQTIADKHNATEAQVSIAWLHEKGVIPIPKATGPDHLRENLAARTLDLADEDVDAIDALERTERQVDPPFAPNW